MFLSLVLSTTALLGATAPHLSPDQDEEAVLEVQAETAAPATEVAPPVSLESALEDEMVPTTFDYTYAYGGISSGEATGIRLGGSYAWKGPWIAQAELSYLNDDSRRVDVDFLRFSASAGYVLKISENIDCVGTVGLEFGKGRVGSNNSTGVGLTTRAGVRYALQPNLELYSGASFGTVLDSGFNVDAGALYGVNESFAGFVEIEFGDLNQFTVGVRYSL